ncbi:hypothetical protein FRB94_007170 [Tulasnella sp. JGI-2019a]|nr:hypothetical protein FRB94_007170 [Tulasnella sp. JGI-2019a]
MTTTAATTGQRSLPIAVVPSCPAGKILVIVRSIRVTETGGSQHILDASPESANVGAGFAGTVAAIGGNVKGFKINDAVYGYIDKGFWVDTLGFFIEKYLIIPPDDLRLISARDTEAFGVTDPAACNGCVIV